MYDLIIQYGIIAIGFILAALGTGLTRYVFVLVGNAIVRDLLGRLWAEIRAAVLEVSQIYTDALKLANLDGKLTAEEKAIAKSKAISIAKKNFGTAGLMRLARILKIDDAWIGNKVEAAVRETQMASAAIPKPQA